jgi:hypothetical protein
MLSANCKISPTPIEKACEPHHTSSMCRAAPSRLQAQPPGQWHGLQPVSPLTPGVAVVRGQSSHCADGRSSTQAVTATLQTEAGTGNRSSAEHHHTAARPVGAIAQQPAAAVLPVLCCVLQAPRHKLRHGVIEHAPQWPVPATITASAQPRLPQRKKAAWEVVPCQPTCRLCSAFAPCQPQHQR